MNYDLLIYNPTIYNPKEFEFLNSYVAVSRVSCSNSCNIWLSCKIFSGIIWLEFWPETIMPNTKCTPPFNQLCHSPLDISLVLCSREVWRCREMINVCVHLCLSPSLYSPYSPHRLQTQCILAATLYPKLGEGGR